MSKGNGVAVSDTVAAPEAQSKAVKVQDIEVQAMGKIAKVMASLGPDEQWRVGNWVHDRWVNDMRVGLPSE